MTLDDPTHPDNQHHVWGNYCLYCHTENYDPASNHGLRLWHYCFRCVLICCECRQEKPLFAFAYDHNSEIYKTWCVALKAGEAALRSWRLVNNPYSQTGNAPREAHLNLCCHCDHRYTDEHERLKKEAATERRQATIQKHQRMMGNPSTQAALDAILKSLGS